MLATPTTMPINDPTNTARWGADTRAAMQPDGTTSRKPTTVATDVFEGTTPRNPAARPKTRPTSSPKNIAVPTRVKAPPSSPPSAAPTNTAAMPSTAQKVVQNL